MIRIPISSQYQQLNLLTTFKNGTTEFVHIQQTANAETAPTVDKGVIIPRFELFVIPNDGKQYWVKMNHGYGHIFVDYNSPEGTIHDTDTGVLAGNGNTGHYTEVVLSVDPGVKFQAVITIDEDDEKDAGEITVEYIDTDTFRVFNTGIAAIAFTWTAIIN
jgi:hypothetical protein